MTVLLSSIIDVNNTQPDGRRLVIERHIDTAGEEYIYTYLANVGEDVEEVLADRAAYLEINIPIWEEERNNREV